MVEQEETTLPRLWKSVIQNYKGSTKDANIG